MANKVSIRAESTEPWIFLKVLANFETKVLHILNRRKQNHLCLLDLSLIGARYNKLDAKTMFLILGEMIYLKKRKKENQFFFLSAAQYIKSSLHVKFKFSVLKRELSISGLLRTQDQISHKKVNLLCGTLIIKRQTREKQ